MRNWKRFGKEGLTLTKVSDCSQLEMCFSPRAVPGAELEWCSSFFVTWTLLVEGDFMMPSTHNVPFLGKWKSRIHSNSVSSQHPVRSSGPRKDCAPVYLGSQMNWWNFVILDINVEEIFSNPEVLWHTTAQTIPITSFKSLTPANYKLLNPRSYWQFR